METGNIDIGNIKIDKIDVDTTNVGKVVPTNKCQGAMSLQGGGANHNDCTPQQLVRLVGYRDPAHRPQHWDRLRPSLIQRQHAE